MRLEEYINKFIDKIGEESNYTNEQFIIVKYVTKVIVYELIKISLMICFFYIIGFLNEALLIIFIMSCTKPFIGGYHENTQIKCLISSIVIIYLIINLSINIDLNLKSSIILNTFSIFSIYNNAPIISERMLITKKSLIKRNRILGICISFILVIISIFTYKYKMISKIIVLTILVQAILMFNKYKKV